MDIEDEDFGSLTCIINYCFLHIKLENFTNFSRYFMLEKVNKCFDQVIDLITSYIYLKQILLFLTVTNFIFPPRKKQEIKNK